MDYRERLATLLETIEKERAANQRYIDKIAELTQTKADLGTRLRTTEEHLGELRRGYQGLQDKMQDTEAKLQHSEEAYAKLYSSNRDSTDKMQACKKEKEYYEKLYRTYKEKTELELVQKDGKIAQQDKAITHLQCQIAAPKKACCRTRDKKAADGLTIDGLQKSLDAERAKNLELTSAIRRLQQQVAERRSRSCRSSSEKSRSTKDEK